MYRKVPLKPFGVLLESKSNNTSANQLNTELLRELFHQEQLVVLRGFKPFESAEDFSNYCERWGEVSLWPFGKVLELVEHDSPADHVFDHSYMPLHWDGMYRPQIPEYQIFHCVRAPLAGQGGRTTFSNTMLALKSLSGEIKELLSKVTGIYQRNMEFYHSKTISPIITKHPYKELSVIRYNEPHSEENGHFLNPPNIEFTGVSEEELDLAQRHLKTTLYAPNNFYAHEWQAGDIVIADNFALLHGREKFISKSPRHIQRVHVLSNPPFDNPALESYQ